MKGCKDLKEARELCKDRTSWCILLSAYSFKEKGLKIMLCVKKTHTCSYNQGVPNFL